MLALIPVVVATAVAGTVTAPWKTRPCVAEYTKGIRGGPLALVLAPDGMLYATEALANRILRFDPNTHATADWPVPKGTTPHGIAAGPDGNLWFTGLNDRLGRFDLTTHQVTLFPGMRRGSEPHDLIWSRGVLYFAELRSGRLGRFDPKTKTIREGAWGLPPGNQIHSIIALPNGDIWAALSNGNKLAKFSPHTHRFDTFVEMPIPNSGPRSIIYVRSQKALYFSLFAANELGRYDLTTRKVELYATTLKPLPLAIANNINTRNEKVTFIATDVHEKYVWASTLSGELFRLDLTGKHTVRKVYCGITFPAGTAALANDRQGRLWVNEAFPGRIARILP